MFQIRLVQTIFSIEILQLKSVLISFHINTFHFSLHINELNTVENSSQESNPVPTSILILAGRGSLRRCSGSFGSSRIYFRLITSGSVNKGESVLIDTCGSVNSHSRRPRRYKENMTDQPSYRLCELTISSFISRSDTK